MTRTTKALAIVGLVLLVLTVATVSPAWACGWWDLWICIFGDPSNYGQYGYCAC